MNAPARCSICNETNHHSSECPTLSEPLKEGFYSGGGHQHTEEDDDG